MILNSYARKVLSVFTEAYPFSAQMRGGRKLRKGNWEKVFPKTETDINAKEDFLRTVEDLVHTGVISVKWKRFREGDQVEALYLEDPALLFQLAGEKDPKAVRAAMLTLIREWRPATSLGKAVKEQLTAKLDYFHDIQIFSEKDLKGIFTIVDLTQERVRGHTLRGLSVYLFQNSKRLEALLPMADKLSRSVEGRDISETLGLTRRFPEALFSCRGTIVLEDPEGISIFLNLENTIDRKIRPFLMDAHTYRKYAEYGYPLKKSALEKCNTITDPRFRELTAEIEKQGRGVEQEVIDLRHEYGEEDSPVLP